jgi:polysaccharide biosynthesis/export protein
MNRLLTHRTLVFVSFAALFASSLAGAQPQQEQGNPSGIHSAYPQPTSPANALPEAVPSPGSISSPGSARNMVIGEGDLLEVSVYGAPDYDRVVRVSGTGDVALPLIGSLHVAGLSIPEAETLLEQRLQNGEYFNDPHVSVFEKEYATQGVSILGEVQKPGVYPIMGSRRLFDAISIAGGTTLKAGKTVTIMHRTNPKEPETVPLGNGSSSAMQNNVQVFPGDTILVSKAGIVYVVGDVHLPGGFTMENGELTVLQALAMAQGANPTASLDSAKLIRRTPQGQQEQPLALKKILTAKAPDLKLQPEDIVFVPNSVGKSAARRGMEAILQAATGVAIYSRR